VRIHKGTFFGRALSAISGQFSAKDINNRFLAEPSLAEHTGRRQGYDPAGRDHREKNIFSRQDNNN
jgi:hypothetical protein